MQILFGNFVIFIKLKKQCKEKLFSRSFEQTNGLKMLLVKNTTKEQERGLDEGKNFIYSYMLLVVKQKYVSVYFECI